MARFPILLFAATLVAATGSNAARLTENILFVTVDGLRWQEVFQGADEALMTRESGRVSEEVRDTRLAKFRRTSVARRRQALMPFLWTEIGAKGQLFGNRARGSVMNVANPFRVSYPGYSEMLTGWVDRRIASNDLRPNPNVTVLEWLNGRPGFAGRVFACAAWQAFPAILNVERSHLPLWITGQHSRPGEAEARVIELETLMDDIPAPWPDEHFDAFVQRRALQSIEREHPRILYVSFGEPDDWAHGRRHDFYLESINRCDRFVQVLWEKMQSRPEYAGKTSLVLSPDHGRGATAQDWTSHGEKVPHSDETWCAVLGPDTPARGERTDAAPATQSQIAATLAALVGEDYPRFAPQAAPPLTDVLGEIAPTAPPP